MKRFNLIIIIIFLFTFSGCIEQNLENDNKKNGYIVYNIGSLPEDLLMFNNAVNFQRDLLYALFEGLVVMDKNSAIMPALAESWSISSDGIEYTFNLREDAKWNDGTPIIAEDFVKFFSEILSPKADNTAASQLNCIYGVEEYYKGKIKFVNFLLLKRLD